MAQVSLIEFQIKKGQLGHGDGSGLLKTYSKYISKEGHDTQKKILMWKGE